MPQLVADSLTFTLLMLAKACDREPMLFVSPVKWTHYQEERMFRGGYAPIQVSVDEYYNLPCKERYKTYEKVYGDMPVHGYTGEEMMAMI